MLSPLPSTSCHPPCFLTFPMMVPMLSTILAGGPAIFFVLVCWQSVELGDQLWCATEGWALLVCFSGGIRAAADVSTWPNFPIVHQETLAYLNTIMVGNQANQLEKCQTWFPSKLDLVWCAFIHNSAQILPVKSIPPMNIGTSIALMLEITVGEYLC